MCKPTSRASIDRGKLKSKKVMRQPLGASPSEVSEAQITSPSCHIWDPEILNFQYYKKKFYKELSTPF